MDDYTANNLTGEERQELDSTAKALGIRVKFADALEGGAQGEYSKGTVLISKDAEDPLRFVYGHEITHRLQETAPEEYAALQEAMKQEYGEDLSQMVQNTIARYGKAGVSLDEAGALDELTADFSGRLIRDRAVLETFIANNRENRSLLQRLLDAIRNMVRKLTGRQQAEARDAEQILLDALNAGTKGKNKNTAQEDGVARWSFAGKDEDGIEIYKTSEEIKKLPLKERKKRFENILSEQYAGRTAKFVAKDGRVYYAKFSKKDISKNNYGDKKSSKAGYKAKINTGADGDIFELVEGSQHNGSGEERGKKIPAHRGVIGWEYFVKTVQIDGEFYDVLANVRKKPDGEYVYSIQLNESRKKSAPALAHAYGSQKETGYALRWGDADKSMITEEESGVNEESKKSIRGGSEELDRAALLRQNRELKERVEELKRETRLTKKATTDRKAVRKAAEEIPDFVSVV